MNFPFKVADVAAFLMTILIFLIDFRLLRSSLKRLELHQKERALERYRQDLDLIFSLISIRIHSIKFIAESLNELDMPECIKREFTIFINNLLFFRSLGENIHKKFRLLYSILISGANAYFSDNLREEIYLTKKKESLEKHLSLLSEFDYSLSVHLFSLFLVPLIVYQLIFLTGVFLLFPVVAILHLITSVYQRKRIHSKSIEEVLSD